MNHTASPRPNILITHSDPLLCAGIAAALREHADFQVFVEGIDAVSSDSPGVDVVVADLETALQLVDRVAISTPWQIARARILVLTYNNREEDIRRTVQAGVSGYLLAGGPLSELVDAVKALANGMRFLGRSVAQRMADSMTRTLLTAREMDVLQHVMNGECNKEIAQRLGIGVGTVKSHMTAILNKLGATSRTHAVSIAAMRGM
jgi:two-component system NarL family response regulator